MPSNGLKAVLPPDQASSCSDIPLVFWVFNAKNRSKSLVLPVINFLKVSGLLSCNIFE